MFNPSDCTLPSVSKMSLLSGGSLTHGNFITNLACDQSTIAGNPNLLIGGTSVKCNDGNLEYSGQSTYQPQCLGNMKTLSVNRI